MIDLRWEEVMAEMVATGLKFMVLGTWDLIDGEAVICRR
jgi:hypothetical protein